MSQRPLQLLLVEDNPGDARLFKEILADASVHPAITTAEMLSEALACVEAQSFDLVLLDLNLPDSQGLETFEALCHRVPDVPIVVLSGLGDETMAVRAVEAGAEDYLVKGEVDGDMLIRSMRYAIVRHGKLVASRRACESHSRGRVLGFMGAKGGVGTTTVALNIASVLAQQDKTVIAAELRSYHGSFASQLKHTPARSLGQLLDVEAALLVNGHLSSRVALLPSGLRVLFGPQHVEEFGELKADQAKAIIDGLAGMAEQVVVDLPTPPAEATATAARLCDFIGLVCEPEPNSLAAARMVLDLLESWGINRRTAGLVVVTRNTLSSSMSLGDLSSELGLEIVGVVPPAVEQLQIAQRFGQPLVVNQPDCVASANFRDMTQRILVGRGLAV